MKRLAMLISGGGTTMQAIIEACQNDPLHGLIDPVLVIASKQTAGGITKAIDAGIDPDRVLICGRKIFHTDEEFGAKLLEMLRYQEIDLVGQYGWLPHTPKNVIEVFKGRIFNQHNAPLDPGRPHFGGDAFYGRRNVCARLYYSRMTGDPDQLWTEATTHHVIPEVDAGDVIAREKVDILPGDDVISLQQRLLEVEHGVQIRALELIATGKAKPLHRAEPLVPRSLVPLLNDSIRIAKILFPHG